ncbi:unnamed protein product, partial [Meganyctiphanes norvegica]
AVYESNYANSTFLLISEIVDKLRQRGDQINEIDDKLSQMSVSFAAALKTSFSSANTCIDLFQKNERRVADLEQDFKQFISKDKKELADGRDVENVVGELKADLRDDHIRKNRVVFFGIPMQHTNWEDHAMVQQLLFEQLGLDIWVLKTFRVKS